MSKNTKITNPFNTDYRIVNLDILQSLEVYVLDDLSNIIRGAVSHELVVHSSFVGLDKVLKKDNKSIYYIKQLYAFPKNLKTTMFLGSVIVSAYDAEQNLLYESVLALYLLSKNKSQVITVVNPDNEYIILRPSNILKVMLYDLYDHDASVCSDSISINTDALGSLKLKRIRYESEFVFAYEYNDPSSIFYANSVHIEDLAVNPRLSPKLLNEAKDCQDRITEVYSEAGPFRQHFFWYALDSKSRKQIAQFKSLKYNYGELTFSIDGEIRWNLNVILCQKNNKNDLKKLDNIVQSGQEIASYKNESKNHVSIITAGSSWVSKTSDELTIHDANATSIIHLPYISQKWDYTKISECNNFKVNINQTIDRLVNGQQIQTFIVESKFQGDSTSLTNQKICGIKFYNPSSWSETKEEFEDYKIVVIYYQYRSKSINQSNQSWPDYKGPTASSTALVASTPSKPTRKIKIGRLEFKAIESDLLVSIKYRGLQEVLEDINKKEDSSNYNQHHHSHYNHHQNKGNGSRALSNYKKKEDITSKNAESEKNTTNEYVYVFYPQDKEKIFVGLRPNGDIQKISIRLPCPELLHGGNYKGCKWQVETTSFARNVSEKPAISITSNKEHCVGRYCIFNICAEINPNAIAPIDIDESLYFNGTLILGYIKIFCNDIKISLRVIHTMPEKDREAQIGTDVLPFKVEQDILPLESNLQRFKVKDKNSTLKVVKNQFIEFTLPAGYASYHINQNCNSIVYIDSYYQIEEKQGCYVFKFFVKEVDKIVGSIEFIDVANNNKKFVFLVNKFAKKFINVDNIFNANQLYLEKDFSYIITMSEGYLIWAHKFYDAFTENTLHGSWTQNKFLLDTSHITDDIINFVETTKATTGGCPLLGKILFEGYTQNETYEEPQLVRHLVVSARLIPKASPISEIGTLLGSVITLGKVQEVVNIKHKNIRVIIARNYDERWICLLTPSFIHLKNRSSASCSDLFDFIVNKESEPTGDIIFKLIDKNDNILQTRRIVAHNCL